MILALAPHTDDACIGAGGYIARLTEQSKAVVITAFSPGNSETGSSRAEFDAAVSCLGVEVIEFLDYEARHYSDQRQEVLEHIDRRIRTFEPELLIIPARHDHQDHRVVYDEACRAVRSRGINVIAYEHPAGQLMTPFQPSYFAKLDARHVRAKINALTEFKSQRDKTYMDPHYVIAAAFRWGPYANARFAESFEVVKWTT